MPKCEGCAVEHLLVKVRPPLWRYLCWWCANSPHANAAASREERAK